MLQGEEEPIQNSQTPKRGNSLVSEISHVSHSKSFFEKEKNGGENQHPEKEIDFPVNHFSNDFSTEKNNPRLFSSKIPTNQKDENLQKMISPTLAQNFKLSAPLGSDIFHSTNGAPQFSLSNLLQNVKSEKDARRKITWNTEGPSIEVN